MPNKREVFSEIPKIDHPSDIFSPHLLSKLSLTWALNERSLSDKLLIGLNVV